MNIATNQAKFKKNGEFDEILQNFLSNYDDLKVQKSK